MVKKKTDLVFNPNNKKVILVSSRQISHYHKINNIRNKLKLPAITKV